MKDFLKFGPVDVSLALAFLCLGLVAGCSGIPTYTPEASQQPAATYTTAPATSGVPVAPGPNGYGAGLDQVHVGDKLVIIFSDTPQPMVPFEETVRDDGMITLPHEKKIKAAGKGKGELADEIRALYVPGIYRKLTVSIKTEDRFFTVSGEVRTPNRLIFSGTMTLLKAIASAGGFTEFANKRRIDIIRTTGAKEKCDWIKAQENPNRYDVPIYPGDQIHVHRRIF